MIAAADAPSPAEPNAVPPPLLGAGGAPSVDPWGSHPGPICSQTRSHTPSTSSLEGRGALPAASRRRSLSVNGGQGRGSRGRVMMTFLLLAFVAVRRVSSVLGGTLLELDEDAN